MPLVNLDRGCQPVNCSNKLCLHVKLSQRNVTISSPHYLCTMDAALQALQIKI